MVAAEVPAPAVAALMRGTPVAVAAEVVAVAAKAAAVVKLDLALEAPHSRSVAGEGLHHVAAAAAAVADLAAGVAEKAVVLHHMGSDSRRDPFLGRHDPSGWLCVVLLIAREGLVFPSFPSFFVQTCWLVHPYWQRHNYLGQPF